MILRRRMNKKGLEDSLFTWIAAFFIIFFFMIIYLFFILVVLGQKKITGDLDKDFSFQESEVDLKGNSKFIDFLNSKILVKDNQEKVIDAIRFSLEPYFELKNEDQESEDYGKSFIERFGFEGLINPPRTRITFGFTIRHWKGWEDVLERIRQADDGKFEERVAEISEALDRRCGGINFLEIPQGKILEGKLVKVSEKSLKAGPPYYKYDPIIHKTNYKRENIEIRSGLVVGHLQPYGVTEFYLWRDCE